MLIHRPSWILGIKNILPIMPSVILFGLILGITGAKGGLSIILTSATSFIIFAGSAQFIVILLLTTGEPLLALIVTGVIINLRHLLYGAVLNPFIKSTGLKKIFVAYLLTDEAFLITTLTQKREQAKIKENELLIDDILIGAGMTLWVCWNIATIIGFLSFSIIKDYLTFSSEFIVSATFLGYFIMHWTDSSSEERSFIIVLSIFATALAFYLQSSTLIIVILILGSFIMMGQGYVSSLNKEDLEV